ncbi:MAG: hypothetical protein ACFWUE_08385 [Xylanivirga thermophila]|uniref:hypothetical protein n=1 Tax=Xylanivirga thermophila TaxID=2496273 RepID=UPI0039F45577
MVNKKRVSKVLVFVLLIGTLLSSVAFAADTKDYVIDKDIKISAKAHIQSFGDKSFETDDKGVLEFGTTGKAKRVEAFALKLEGAPKDMAIEYRVHGQSYGDMPAEADKWIRGDKEIGSRGKAKRIEGVQIRLVNTETGKAYEGYSVEYQVHMQSFGWGANKTDKGDVWVKDGEFAGTKGLSKRLEAVRVRIKKEDKLKITGFEAIGAKKLEVKFNKPVKDVNKAKIDVKKGLVSVNVKEIEFSADKTSAVITTVTDLTKGEYTVIVSGLTEEALKANVSVEDVKVSEIRLISDKAPMRGNAGTEEGKEALVNYEVLNQYGDKMAATVNWTASTGQPLTTTNDGKLVLKSPTYFTPNQTVYVTGVHVQSGTVLNTTVSIVLPSSVDTLEFKGIYDIVKGEFTKIPAGFENDKFEILFETKDQYGNKVTPKTGDIVFTSNNPLLATVEATTSRKIGGTEYQAVKLNRGVNCSRGGSVTIQGISIYTGKTATYTIEVPAVATIKSFTMSAPTTIVAEGEKVELPFTAIDQFGNEITKYDALKAAVDDETLRFIVNPSSEIKFVKKTDGSAKLQYTAPTGVAFNNIDYPIYISSVILGGNTSNLSFSVKEKAVAKVVVGLEGVSTNLVEGATTKIEPKNIKVQDQHGRTILWKDYSGTESLTLTSENGLVDVTGDAEQGFTLTAKSKGAANLTFKIGTEDASKYTFNINVVKANDVVSYEIADVPLMKAGTKKELVLTGKLANGTSAVLNATDVVKKVVSSDESVVTIEEGNLLNLIAAGSLEEAKKDATAVVVVTIEGPTGPIIITKDIKVSYQVSKAETIKVDDEIFVDDFEDTTLLSKFKVIDQYGEEMKTDKGVIVKTNEVKENNKTVGWTVTLITPNGKTATSVAKLAEK